MLKPNYTNRFEKDVNLMKKRGKNLDKMKSIIKKILGREQLDLKHRAHRLVGRYKDFWECHIEPDWLLIYLPEPAQGFVTFTRTGTHSDLFK